ncbi:MULTISPECIES: hypothetical protein [unclassified Carboxylicivirga]|uniref:hypothetical protein n=1 Tax=Carboxylicivirga TaxID=1628153 RepID=UPI003D3307F9
MKKQTLNIKSTLSNKVSLSKKPKAIDVIKTEIEDIHKTPKVAKNEFFRTTVYLPKSLHKDLKILVAQSDTLTMKDFVIEAVQEKLQRISNG